MKKIIYKLRLWLIKKLNAVPAEDFKAIDAAKTYLRQRSLRKTNQQCSLYGDTAALCARYAGEAKQAFTTGAANTAA